MWAFMGREARIQAITEGRAKGQSDGTIASRLKVPLAALLRFAGPRLDAPVAEKPVLSPPPPPPPPAHTPAAAAPRSRPAAPLPPAQPTAPPPPPSSSQAHRSWISMTRAEREQAIRELRAEGLSARQIGSVLGCSGNAVIGQAHRSKINLSTISRRHCARRPARSAGQSDVPEKTHEKPASASKAGWGWRNPPKQKAPEQRESAEPSAAVHPARPNPLRPVFAPPPAGGVPFFEIRGRQCRRPLWADGEERSLPPAQLRFCGAPTLPSRPYCPECQPFLQPRDLTREELGLLDQIRAAKAAGNETYASIEEGGE